jgi:hypothetical protein
VRRKSSALGLDDPGHASSSPAPKLEKEPDVAALTGTPSTATIVQLSVTEETHALSSVEAQRDVSGAQPAKENKSGTNEPSPKMLTGELIMPPHPRVLICQKLD